MDLFSEAFTWVGLICGWSLACGLGLIMDWDDISEHFRRFSLPYTDDFREVCMVEDKNVTAHNLQKLYFYIIIL